VATDFGDYRQLLGESGAGLLTEVAPEPLADGILKVLGDPALAASLAAATAPVAREYFAMDRNIDRYLDVYRRATGASPRGGPASQEVIFMKRNFPFITLLVLGLTDLVGADEPAKKYEVISPKDDGIIATGINGRGEIVGFEWIEEKARPGVLSQVPFYARG